MTSKIDLVRRGLVLIALAAVAPGLGCSRNGESAERPAAKTTESHPVQAAMVPDPTSSSTKAAPSPAVAPERESPAIPGDPELPSPEVTSSRASEDYPRPEDVPLAPMGEKIGFSPVTQSPGYVPPNDPEADAVRTGRRKAAKVDVPFTGGRSTPELLAQDILDALKANDFDALRALRVTEDEFTRIMYQEFPESRPICNSDAGTAYFFLDRTNHSGCWTGLSHWGGQDLQLLGIRYTIGRAPYTNFTLYRGVEIHVLKADGGEGVMKFARTFAERNGTWKVYSFKDRE